MSDNDESDVKPFAIEKAKQGRASCKKCKTQCEVILISFFHEIYRKMFLSISLILFSRAENFASPKSIPTIHSVPLQ
jgi:hypothetical protein